MNHEFKVTLIENIPEYKHQVLSEITEITELTELLKFIDKIISIQYYKGIFIPDEYDEILSEKIDEIIDVNIEYAYDENEFKYFIKELLESYDIFLSKLTFNIEIDNKMKIKSKYLISEYDSAYYLDEININYLDEIFIYENKDELIESINDIQCISEHIQEYFNYNEYISDSGYIKFPYKPYTYAYIENFNEY